MRKFQKGGVNKGVIIGDGNVVDRKIPVRLNTGEIIYIDSIDDKYLNPDSIVPVNDSVYVDKGLIENKAKLIKRKSQSNTTNKIKKQFGYENWKKKLPLNLQDTTSYNLKGAYEAGLQPELIEGEYHLPSRNPVTGEILKSKDHPTFNLAIEEDKKLGYLPYIDDEGKIYTFDKKPNMKKYKPYKRQFGGTSQNILAEDGELFLNENGEIQEVRGFSHDDPFIELPNGQKMISSKGNGGQVLDDAQSVLSDSYTQVEDGDRKNTQKEQQVAIKSKDAKKLFDYKWFNAGKNKKYSPSELVREVISQRDKRLSRYSDVQKDDALSLSTNQLNASLMPSDEDIYDVVLGKQEDSKRNSKLFIEGSNKGYYPTDEELEFAEKYGYLPPSASNTGTAQYGGSVPINPNGLYEEDGPVIVPTNGTGNITMRGVDQNVLAYNADTGEYLDTMTSGNNYQFDADNILEIPISQYGREEKRFLKNYIDSPNYRRRLLQNGHSISDLVQRKMNLDNVKIDVLPKAQGNRYIPSKNRIEIDLDETKSSGVPQSTALVHELSHSAGSVGSGVTMGYGKEWELSPEEIVQLEKRNKLSKIDTQKLTGKEWGKVHHDKQAGESKADMDALRFRLKKDGIYDTGTQNFNQDILNKAKSKYQKDTYINRLFKNYSDKDLIYLMNNIAMNSNNEYTDISKAQFGEDGTYFPPKYTIKQGDSLSKIAESYGLTLQQLLDENPSIANANRINVGDTLTIPDVTIKANRTQEPVDRMSEIVDIQELPEELDVQAEDVIPTLDVSNIVENVVPITQANKEKKKEDDKIKLGKIDRTQGTNALREMMRANRSINLPYRTETPRRLYEYLEEDVTPYLDELDSQSIQALQNVNQNTAQGQAIAANILNRVGMNKRQIINRANATNLQRRQQVDNQNVALQNQFDLMQEQSNKNYVDETYQTLANYDRNRVQQAEYLDEMINQNTRTNNFFTLENMRNPNYQIDPVTGEVYRIGTPLKQEKKAQFGIKRKKNKMC